MNAQHKWHVKNEIITGAVLNLQCVFSYENLWRKRNWQIIKLWKKKFVEAGRVILQARRMIFTSRKFDFYKQGEWFKKRRWRWRLKPPCSRSIKALSCLLRALQLKFLDFWCRYVIPVRAGHIPTFSSRLVNG